MKSSRLHGIGSPRTGLTNRVRAGRSTGSAQDFLCAAPFQRDERPAHQGSRRRQMVSYQYPQDADLRRLVRFSSEDGTVWLGEHRMLLLHTAALGSLHKELINSVGLEQARRILTRMGFASGCPGCRTGQARSAATSSPTDAFFVGPQLAHARRHGCGSHRSGSDMDISAGKFLRGIPLGELLGVRAPTFATSGRSRPAHLLDADRLCLGLHPTSSWAASYFSKK